MRRPDQHAGAAAKSSAGQRGADVQTPLREPPINPQDKEQPSCEQLGQPPREQALNPRQQAQPFTPPIAAGTSPLTARPSVTPSALPLPAMPPVAYGSPPQQAPFPSPRCLTEPGHPQPSPSSPRECASAFVQLPQYGAQACLSSAHPVSAKVGYPFFMSAFLLQEYTEGILSLSPPQSQAKPGKAVNLCWGSWETPRLACSL